MVPWLFSSGGSVNSNSCEDKKLLHYLLHQVTGNGPGYEASCFLEYINDIMCTCANTMQETLEVYDDTHELEMYGDHHKSFWNIPEI